MGAVGGRIFGLPIDLAHRLYNSLLLSHKPWEEGSVSQYEEPQYRIPTFTTFSLLTENPDQIQLIWFNGKNKSFA